MVSLTIDTHINIVMEDIVWSTGTKGPNFKYPTVVLTNAGTLLCKVCDSEDRNLGDVDTTRSLVSLEIQDEHIPVSLTSQKSGGRPLVALQEICDNCDTTETDTDPHDLLSVDHTERLQRQKSTGKASPQHCMLCCVGLPSRKALAFYLKSIHPQFKPYRCLDCMNAFNNSNNLATHWSNTHRKKVVHCKHCTYTLQTKARMHLHMSIHTTGFKCIQCGSKFLIQRALNCHLKLHEKHHEYPCATCGKIFATLSSKNIHTKGKHGVGYV